MDVSAVLAAQSAKYKSIVVDKDIPLEADTGLLTVTDLNPVDKESYDVNLEEHLLSLARDGIQHLLASIFACPTKSSPDGPLAILPTPKTLLPRAKPLAKPKPLTKWQLFANAKGIQHRTKDKVEFDDEKQEWVKRWGKGGKNKEVEEQWIHVLPSNAPDDFDPVAEARTKRKEHVAKNEKQRLSNLAHSDRDTRKAQLERTLATTRTSTASMGKFDKKLEGDPKLRGVKRKFQANEKTHDESAQSLAILSKLDGHAAIQKRIKRGGENEDAKDIVNIRKAVKFASKGRGTAALARESTVGGGRSRGGKTGGRGGKGGGKKR